MKKEMIKIPANIKYLTEREKFIEEFGKPFELPNGILNKEDRKSTRLNSSHSH